MHDQTTHPTNEELLRSLDDVAPVRPEWNPEPGDKAVGRVSRFDYLQVRGTERVLPILTLETEDGDLRIAVKHSILRDELLKSQVQIGDRLAIAYLGQPAGKRYHRWAIRVAAEGPRQERLRFATEPRAEDLDLTAEAESLPGEPSPW